MDQATAGQRVFSGSLVDLRGLWMEVDGYLTERGLRRDVKTIYVSYTDQGLNLVAAIHPDVPTHSFEVALAIPDADTDGLYDATHLKWRALPVAVRVGESGYFTPEDIRPFLDRAIDNAPIIQLREASDFHGRRNRSDLTE